MIQTSHAAGGGRGWLLRRRAMRVSSPASSTDHPVRSAEMKIETEVSHARGRASPFVRTVFSGLATVLFAGSLLDALRGAVGQSLKELRSARQHIGEGLLEARRRILSPAYTDAIERIREAIPPGASYVLGRRAPGDAQYWVRYDLLPRRPVWGGVPGEEGPNPAVFTLPPETPVVLCSVQEEAPTLVTWAEFRKDVEAKR